MTDQTVPQNGANGNNKDENLLVATDKQTKWRIIPNWPEYQVSENGDIRRIAPAAGAVVGRILKPMRNQKTKYFSVCLCRNSKPVRIDIHRLVALTFLGPQPSKNHLVAHNDGSRTNNHYLNIRWATQSENLRDCHSHGTSRVGASNPMARLDEIDVHAIHRMKVARIPTQTIADGFGLHKRTVFSILSGQTWGHIR